MTPPRSGPPPETFRFPGVATSAAPQGTTIGSSNAKSRRAAAASEKHYSGSRVAGQSQSSGLQQRE